MSKGNTLQQIVLQGMLPLFYFHDSDVSIGVIKTLYSAGVRVVEYTNRGSNALVNFRAIKKAQEDNMPDMQVGIGTIKTKEEATAFIAAGADFIVSPIVSPDVAICAEAAGLLWCPGCMTPTEIELAKQHGAGLIKLFPANILGPTFMHVIRDLFPGQAFMPTGGVELFPQNIAQWFKSGVCAVGLGSKLITGEILAEERFDLLLTATENALALIKNNRI